MKEHLEFLKTITSIIAPIFAMIFAIINTLTEKKAEVKIIENGEQKTIKKYTIWAKISTAGLIISATITLFTYQLDKSLAKVNSELAHKKDSINQTKIDSIRLKSEKIYGKALDLTKNLNTSLDQTTDLSQKSQEQLKLLNNASVSQAILIKNSQKLSKSNTALLHPLFPLKVEVLLNYFPEAINTSQERLIVEIKSYLLKNKRVRNEVSRSEIIFGDFYFEYSALEEHDTIFENYKNRLFNNFVPNVKVYFLSNIVDSKIVDMDKIDVLEGSLDLIKTSCKVKFYFDNDSDNITVLVVYDDISSDERLKSFYDISNGLMLINIDALAFNPDKGLNTTLFNKIAFHCGPNFSSKYLFHSNIREGADRTVIFSDPHGNSKTVFSEKCYAIPIDFR